MGGGSSKEENTVVAKPAALINTAAPASNKAQGQSLPRNESDAVEFNRPRD